MEQTPLLMHKSPAVATPARKFARLTQVCHGHLDEEKTWSNASANTTENDWTPRERKDAESKVVSVSIRSLETSTLRQEGVSAMATCTSTI